MSNLIVKLNGREIRGLPKALTVVAVLPVVIVAALAAMVLLAITAVLLLAVWSATA